MQWNRVYSHQTHSPLAGNEQERTCGHEVYFSLHQLGGRYTIGWVVHF